MNPTTQIKVFVADKREKKKEKKKNYTTQLTTLPTPQQRVVCASWQLYFALSSKNFSIRIFNHHSSLLQIFELTCSEAMNAGTP